MGIQNDLSRLSRRLGHAFKDINLLKQALTHCSVGAENNERLEFLGDAILNFSMANLLYHRFQSESEGQLSRLRAFLVKGETLAEIAFELQLGDYLYLGQGELKSGGFRRVSILADALEAIIAAVFLDAGILVAQQFIENLYNSRLENSILQTKVKDSKTLLQEFLQSKKHALPIYQLVKQEGDDHEQVFHISCTIANISTITEGIGANRRKAEQQAADLMLHFLISVF